MKIYKYLNNLHVLPWCFHLMGNNGSCIRLQDEPTSPPQLETIELISLEGLVRTYHKPVPVSELLTQFPKHLICRSDSFYIGRKIPALAESEHLQLGHKYFLLPKRFFQSVLSFVTIASFVSSRQQEKQDLVNSFSSSPFLKKLCNCQRPFDIQKTASGCLRIRVSDEFIAQLVEEAKIREDFGKEASADEERRRISNKLCTTPLLEKEYSQLVVGSRNWKPKLDTIIESEKRDSTLIGIRKRSYDKKSSKGMSETYEQRRHSHHVSAMKPPCKDKIKFRSRK